MDWEAASGLHAASEYEYQHYLYPEEETDGYPVHAQDWYESLIATYQAENGAANAGGSDPHRGLLFIEKLRSERCEGLQIL